MCYYRYTLPPCDKCVKWQQETVRFHPPKDIDVEGVGKRLVRLATEPITTCPDCGRYRTLEEG